MTKEEKIKEAYGIYYDIALGLCDENGWIKSFEYYTFFPCNKEKLDIEGILCFRTKSLQGIENNNGWIKIERESDLPKEGYGLYHVMSIEPIFCKEPKNQNTDEFWSDDESKTKNWLNNYSHYQPIQKPQPPIY